MPQVSREDKMAALNRFSDEMQTIIDSYLPITSQFEGSRIVAMRIVAIVQHADGKHSLTGLDGAINGEMREALDAPATRRAQENPDEKTVFEMSAEERKRRRQ